MKFYPTLQRFLERIIEEFDNISSERKDQLELLAQKVVSNSDVSLTFICTHNSRRSHFGQVWATIASKYYGLNTSCFSGGTEETRFNINAIRSLERSGLKARNIEGQNPEVQLSYNEEDAPIICFSKVFDHPINPTENFIAVMTCSDASENCPFIPGTKHRVPLTYEDPKMADGTSKQDETYDARSQQIATEMMYLFQNIKSISHV